MVKITKFILLSVSVATSLTVAASPEPNKPSTGGAVLEYPRGRFQENLAPNFFKWSVRQKVKSITLKLFKANLQAEYNPDTDLVTRYDFTPSVQSLNLLEESLPIGNYVWVVEGYDDQSPAAIYADKASFRIEPLRQFEAKTKRLGLIAGFARGTYNTKDIDNKINFRTTPTTYGILFSGGSEKTLWETQAYMSDFILRGSVNKTTTIFGNYMWILPISDPNKLRLYAGPTFRILSFPQVRSPDGTNISTSTETLAMPGGAIKLEGQLDQHIMAHAHFGFDTAVFGSQTVDFKLDKGSFNAHAGLLYSLFWPIGFNGEIQYKLDQAVTKDSGSTITMQADQWAVVANLIYAL